MLATSRSLGAAAAIRGSYRLAENRSRLMRSMHNVVNLPSSPPKDDKNQSSNHHQKSMDKNATEAARITKVGMGLNIGMAIGKASVGTWSGSTALVADAAHSLSDLISDIVTLASVNIARLPADNDHPYGYGKFEAVGSLSIGALLVAAGTSVGLEGIYAIEAAVNATDSVNAAIEAHSNMTEYLPQVSRDMQLYVASAVAVASIGAKEALYRATVKIGEKTRSNTLIANAWHHRTDAISSVFALGGVVGTLAGFPLLDPLAGVAVAAMIVKVGGEIAMDSVLELTDKSVESEVLDMLNHTTSTVEDVVSVSNVRARKMGPYILVDLRIQVHGRASISHAQQIAGRVKNEILQNVPDVSDALVHIDAAVPTGSESSRQFASSEEHHNIMRPYREIRNDIKTILATIPEIQLLTHLDAHWVALNPSQDVFGTMVEVTITLSPDLTVRDAHVIAQKARREIENRIPYVAEADIHLDLFDKEE